MYKCPRCKTRSISFKDKYKTGIWGEICCPNCKAKLCAWPWLLALIWVAYAWDVAWFSGLFYYTRNPMDFAYMIIVWLLIDAVNVSYMPLAVMTQPARQPENKD
jgi:hypothetical protein